MTRSAMGRPQGSGRTPTRVEPEDSFVARTPAGTRVRALLINAFEKIPGENFRDQRYTFLYEILKSRAEVVWFSSDFHHWSHSRRSADMMPVGDRASIRLIRTLSYTRNVSIRRFVSYVALSVATLWNLWRLEKRPDVIICMGPVEQMFLVALHGRLCRIPVIIDIIDPWPDVYLKAFPSRVRWLGGLLLAPYFLMSRATFALCTRGTAVSETYLSWAMTRGRRNDRESFAHYYLGARNDEFDVSRAPEPTDSISCLFAGQFGFSYDVELILDAAEALQSAGRSDIRFVLCGAGDKQAEVTRRARSLANVELHGWLTPAQLNDVGLRCQVGLCTYRASATQSLPTKLFDYFSMGLYVVSSLAGEAQTLLSAYDVGRYYAAGDVNSFIECLQDVRREIHLGAARRAVIRSAFDVHFSSRAIYERMVDEVIFPVARRARALEGASSE